MRAIPTSSSNAATTAHGRLSAPLRAVNLSEQAAAAIVDAIADGALKPGQRLIDAEVAADLGVSRLPVREALKMLAAQGIVELNLHRGARIAEFGEDRIANVRAVRTAIECAAFAKAAARLKAQSEPRTLSQLDAIIDAMKRAEERSDLPALNRLDIAFHRTIVTAAADPFLTALWEAQALHLQIVFAREVRTLPRPIPYASVHLAIRFALIQSSAAALRDLIAKHIAGQSRIDLPVSPRLSRTNQNKNRRKP